MLSRLLVLTISLFCLESFAAPSDDKGSFQSTKLGVFQQTYSGAANKSFANGSPALGVELTLDNGFSMLRYFFRSRFVSAEGQQNFLNGTTVFNSRYKFSQFAPELGLSFFPIPRRDRGLNIFVWGTGNVSYNNLEIKTLPTGSTLFSKEQTFGYGYGGGMGIEYIIGAVKGNKFLLFSEIGFREERVQLTKKEFDLSGMTISFGVGF